jgi:SAM-dependent methyltransferase
VLEENLWGYRKRFEFVSGHLSGRRAETVLDVGCGNGSQLAIPLAAAGYRVTGIDTDLPSIERGRKLSNQVNFIHGHLANLALGQFDAVIISEVLEHVDAPDALLAETLTFLSPTGLLIVTVPNGYGEFEIDRRVFGLLRLEAAFEFASAAARRLIHKPRTEAVAGSDDETPHVQFFTRGRLNDMFYRHRLDVIDQAATSFMSGPLVAHTIGRIPGFAKANAAIADVLPMVVCSGWMFAMTRRRTAGPERALAPPYESRSAPDAGAPP